MRIVLLFVASLLAVAFARAANGVAPKLTLDQYRLQVSLQNPDLRAAELKVEGSRLAEPGGEALTDTQVIASAYYNDDRRPTTNPGFQGDRTETEAAMIGLRKQFLWGPTFQISQNFNHTEIFNASTTAVPLADYYDSYPKVSLSVPLWRNFNGAQIRAQQEMLQTQARVDVVKADIQYVEATSRVELAFFTLAAARENLILQKDILDRASRISQWVGSQYRRGLVDVADLHQAQAAVAMRKIQLQEAEVALKKAAREFNSLRGIPNEVVEVELEVPQLPLEKLKLLSEKIKFRKDLVLQQLATKAQQLTSLDRLETAKPQLDLTVEGQWNGRDEEYSEAQSESFKEDQTLWYVGLQFSMPLDVPRYMKVREGFRKMNQADEYSARAQVRDMQNAWKEYVDQGETLYQQIELVRELEEVQKKKADAERLRLTRGRSTTYQVLSFEQDYISAKNQRINLELKAREYLTQTGLFEESL